MAFYLRGSKATVDHESQINDWEILLMAETLEEVEGYFHINLEDEPKEGEKVEDTSFWAWKHLEILDESLTQFRYYFIHEWRPKSAMFRLKPVYEKIAQYVKLPDCPEKVADLNAFREKQEAKKKAFEESLGLQQAV